MAITEADPYVTLYGVPWDTYEKILDALARHRLRHAYDRGTLQMRGLLYGVAWQDYRNFLHALGDYGVRHTYCQGSLEMMSPRKDHDWVKSLMARLIETMALELDIDIQTIGSTTLVAENAQCGLQPDEAYYIAHEPEVRGKETYEPDDPPPDLAIEVDVTSSSVQRLPVFAALGIPEVWRYDGRRLRFYRLKPEKQYQEEETSAAFPFLKSSDFQSFLDERRQRRENELVRAFADWVRKAAQDPDQD